MKNLDERIRKTADGGTLIISYSVLGVGMIVLFTLLAIIRICDYNFGWGIELRDYISICSFGVVTVGLVYNAIALQCNFALNKAKFEKEDMADRAMKIRISYEIISEWYKSDMAMNAELVRRFIQPFKGKLNNPDIFSNFKNELEREENFKVKKSLIAVLNYFEHLTLLSMDNVIDEDILRKTFRNAFLSYFNNLKEYIEYEQRKNEGANGKIFSAFVEITRKWMYVF